MALNPDYLVAPSLQEYFVDKRNGQPLAGGRVFFYSDVNRTQPKTVYRLNGDAPNYSYVALPNPVILSSVGTVVDENGNDVLPYYYPLDSDGLQELYYIVVEASDGYPQFTREAWPNPQVGDEPVTQSTELNLIPNGQFLIHTDLPNNLLIGGTNVIAQGGWTFELPASPLSTNTLTFIPLPFSVNPPQSPRFNVQIECTNFNPLDDIKNLRIKFNDVNKFSASDSIYTFAFWAESNVNVPVSVQVYKFFGTNGSVVPAVVVGNATITPNGTVFQFQFSFGLNTGYNVDTINNDDYVSIDIAFPTGLGFRANLTNFAMASGNVNLEIFPLQTNADMISRGLAGWIDTPNYSGEDLYLPVILTRGGMKFDKGVIGKVEASVASVGSPLVSSPLPISNDMPCDGASYIYDDYSVLGIPFARLGQYLIDNSPVDGVPLFGTGLDFATAYPYSTELDILRLSVNSNGAGIPAASDGNTGWNFKNIVTYGASLSGSISLGYNAYSNLSNTILSIGDFVTPLIAPATNTSGFTVTTLNYVTGLLAQQFYAITVQCVAASSLIAGSGNVADYWTFSSDSINYYMWFYFNGELDPNIAGRTGIRIDLRASYTAQDVSNIVREAMNAYQMSEVEVTSIPTFSQYWFFATNPISLIQYYAWYNVDGNGSDPLIPGRVGIKIDTLSTDTIDIVTEKTWRAIDKYKYASPGFSGMFLRGADFSGIYDKDVAQRWSSISGLSGANYGTFEFEQLLSHGHTQGAASGGATGDIDAALRPNGTNRTNSIAATGGSETRPVNAYVNYVIKY